MKNLEILDLSSTRVTDAGLEHIEALTELWSLKIPSAGITNAAVARLRAALPRLDEVIQKSSDLPK